MTRILTTLALALAMAAVAGCGEPDHGPGVIGEREVLNRQRAYTRAVAARSAVKVDSAFVGGRGGHLYTFRDGYVLFIEGAR